MSRSMIFILAGFVVAGGGFYYVASGADGPEETVREDGPSPSSRSRTSTRRVASTTSRSSGDRDGGDLERRVAALEKELKTVKAQLRMQRGAIVARAGAPDYDDADPVFGDSGGGGEVFEERVRDVLESEREAERERRDERRRDRIQERNTEALNNFASVAGVAASVQTDIGNLWTAESEQLMEIISQARGGDRDWGEVRDEIQKLRAETDASAKEMLSEDQYAKYLENRPQGGPGRGGRGGRGGGGGGGGGPRGGGPPPP